MQLKNIPPVLCVLPYRLTVIFSICSEKIIKLKSMMLIKTSKNKIKVPDKTSDTLILSFICVKLYQNLSYDQHQGIPLSYYYFG